MATMATVRNSDSSVNERKTEELEQYLKNNGCKFVTYKHTGSHGYEPDCEVPRLARKYAEKIGATIEFIGGAAAWSASVKVILRGSNE